MSTRNYTPKDISRFYNKIAVMQNGCYEWQGAHSRRGYGRIIKNGKEMYIHRVAWEIFNGPIPDGLFCLHKCDNPRCCNPAHLFLGTQKDNMRDCARKGRTNKTVRARGEKQGSAKLVEGDVVRIREMYASGTYSQRKLASMFHIDQSTIGDIVRRETWAHVV